MGDREESASLLRASAGGEGRTEASASCCAKEEDEEKAPAAEGVGKPAGAAAQGAGGCQSGACNAACRVRAAQHRKKLAELREQRKWHRGDFNYLYNSTVKGHRADGADVEPGDADGAVVPAIVWSCLPCVTMFAPFVGHVGVLRSDGALLDFAMSYAINLDRPAFGKPIRLLSLEPYMRAGGGDGGAQHESFEFERAGAEREGGKVDGAERYVCSWDRILSEAVREYQNEQYSFFSNNCHTFVAHCLNKARIPGPSAWAARARPGRRPTAPVRARPFRAGADAPPGRAAGRTHARTQWASRGT